MMRDEDLPDAKLRHLGIRFEALGAAAAPVVDEVRQVIDSKYPQWKGSGLMEPFYEKVKNGEGPRRLLP